MSGRVEPVPLACRVDAFSAAQRERHQILLAEIPTHRQEILEIDDGYAVRFPADPALALRLAELLTLERLCCPFLTLELIFEPDDGPIWLRFRGSAEGIKPFLRAELGLTPTRDSVGPAPGARY